MVTIYFTSGKELSFEYDWNKLAPKLQLGGLRMFTPNRGILIPLNSSTIERIEIQEDEEDVREKETDRVGEDTHADESPVGQSETTGTDREDQPVELVDEKPKSAQQKAEEALAYMKEMSECPHEKHLMYYSESLVGKARKPVRRFFPVCAKCGVREKFVKAESLPEEVKETATLWTDK